MCVQEIPSIDHPIDAVVGVPGSKSITNRALMVAALAHGQSVLRGALFSEDTHWFSECLLRLGIQIQADQAGAQFAVDGLGGEIPTRQADLFVGNAGTAARFITALIALGDGSYRMDGVPRMRERPMSELLDVLAKTGAALDFADRPGCMPYTLHARGFTGGAIRLQAAQTSQQLSALLMIAPYARQQTSIEVMGDLVSRSYIDITCRVMADFGVAVSEPVPNRFTIQPGQRYHARDYTVEPDASNASYFFAAAAVTGGRVRVNHLTNRSVQGDLRFIQVLEAMGCQVDTTDSYTEVKGPPQLRGIDIDMNDISDTVQTLAAIAPFADSPVTIRNIAHIRLKETDRITAVVTELRRLGVTVEEYPDGLTIMPGPMHPAAIHTYDDHRMAMAFAVAGLKSPGIVIKNPECTAKTFPDFFERFFLMLESSVS